MKKLLNTLAGQDQKCPPLWFMRQAGRYLPEYRAVRKQTQSFWELCFTPSLAAEVTLQPIRRFNLDAAIIFSDILTVPHILGQTVEFKPDAGPRLNPVDWSSFLSAGATVSVTDGLQPVYEALKIVRDQLPKETALIGFAGAPWTVATYMVGGGKSSDFSKIISWMDCASPLDDLISLLVDSTIHHLSAQIEAGAEAIQIFDTWATVVPSHHRDRLIFDPLLTIVNGIRSRHPEVPIIYYAKGLSKDYYQIRQKNNNLAFSIDHFADRDTIAFLQDSGAILQGNLSPEILVEGGKALDQEIDRVLSSFSKGPFIANLGHGILPQTPIPHVEHFIRRIRHG